MALVPFGGFVPPLTRNFAGAPSTVSYTIDAAGEKAGAVFYAPKTGNIRKIHFATNTVTTGDTVDVRVETVDLATGFPTGTLVGTNTNGAVVIASSDDNVFKVATLTADAAVTIGQLIGVVIANGSGGGVIQLRGSNDDANLTFPYGILFTTAWAAVTNPFMLGVEYDDGSFGYIEGLWLPWSLTTATYSNVTSPNQIGNKWTPEFDCVVIGAWVWANLAVDCDINLYGADGFSPIIVPALLDATVRAASGAGLSLVRFATEPTLNAGSAYRMTLAPRAANAQIYELAYPTAASLGQLGLGTSMHKTSCGSAAPTGHGSWTDVTTERVTMGFWLGSISDKAGGGPLIGGRLIQ